MRCPRNGLSLLHSTVGISFWCATPKGTSRSLYFLLVIIHQLCGVGQPASFLDNYNLYHTSALYAIVSRAGCRPIYLDSSVYDTVERLRIRIYSASQC